MNEKFEVPQLDDFSTVNNQSGNELTGGVIHHDAVGNEQGATSYSKFKPFSAFEKEEKYYKEEEYNKAMNDTYQRAFADGKKEAEKEYQRNLSEVDEAANVTIDQILNFLQENQKVFFEQKKDFTIAVTKILNISLKKILHDKLEENSSDILQDMMLKAKDIYKEKLSLKIYLSPQIKEKLEKSFGDKLKQSGYEGEVTFVEDAAASNFVARIEWEKSGVAFNITENISEIENLVNEYIKSL